MKKVKSFGCSFSFGTDLPDINNNQPSKLTWPALVANHLDLKYECYAVGGCGNLQILENILNQVMDAIEQSKEYMLKGKHHTMNEA